MTPPTAASVKKCAASAKYAKMASAPQVQARHTAMEQPETHPVTRQTVDSAGSHVILVSIV